MREAKEHNSDHQENLSFQRRVLAVGRYHLLDLFEDERKFVRISVVLAGVEDEGYSAKGFYFEFVSAFVREERRRVEGVEEVAYYLLVVKGEFADDVFPEAETFFRRVEKFLMGKS